MPHNRCLKHSNASYNMIILRKHSLSTLSVGNISLTSFPVGSFWHHFLLDPSDIISCWLCSANDWRFNRQVAYKWLYSANGLKKEVNILDVEMLILSVSKLFLISFKMPLIIRRTIFTESHLFALPPTDFSIITLRSDCFRYFSYNKFVQSSQLCMLSTRCCLCVGSSLFESAWAQVFEARDSGRQSLCTK